MKDLSAKQQRILDYIGAFIDEHDYPPSIRQIQEACDISSTSVVDYNLRILERQGHIRRDREVSRGIEMLHGGRRAPRVVSVPVYGSIAAGNPIDVPDGSRDPDDYIDVDPEIVSGREDVFAVRVKGESMIEDLINDGDIVILEKIPVAQDGDTVAAWIEDEQETTLKRIYLEGERVRLQPANRTMDPIYKDAAKVRVQGRVLGVHRNFA
ncbi:MAG TPA: transcriptional repressor LexA [Dehalococcoidia bacterium]